MRQCKIQCKIFNIKLIVIMHWCMLCWSDSRMIHVSELVHSKCSSNTSQQNIRFISVIHWFIPVCLDILVNEHTESVESSPYMTFIAKHCLVVYNTHFDVTIWCCRTSLLFKTQIGHRINSLRSYASLPLTSIFWVVSCLTLYHRSYND